MVGNDGKQYISKPNINKNCSWKKYNRCFTPFIISNAQIKNISK